MHKAYFVLKIETRFQSLDAYLVVSSAINEAEVVNEVKKRLSVLGLNADTRTLNYHFKENQLYVEGWAFEHNHETQSSEMFFSS